MLHLLVHEIIELLVLFWIFLPPLHDFLFIFICSFYLFILLIDLGLKLCKLFLPGFPFFCKKFHYLLHFLFHCFKNVCICHSGFSVRGSLRISTLSHRFSFLLFSCWLIEDRRHAWSKLVLLKVSRLGTFGRACYWTLLRCFLWSIVCKSLVHWGKLWYA